MRFKALIARRRRVGAIPLRFRDAARESGPGRQRLPLLLLAATLTTLLSISLVAFAGAAPGIAGAAPTTVTSVTTPDPVAAKRLGCQPGQTDVNSATVAQLQALGLARPIAERVVAHREPLYLDLNDLLAVEGIGPGRVDALVKAGQACADLPVSPPPTDAHVCVPGDGRVDVNRPSSLPALRDMFGGPTADRIVAGIPYAGVASVVAEHIPGAGQGKQAKLIGRLCDTPPTIDHGDTRWGWISTAGGRVDHPDDATLTVPSGVLDDANGAWGSIRPLDHDSLYGGPKFDFAINGAWQGNGDVVFTTLPRDTLDPPGDRSAWTPTLLHYATANGDPVVHALAGLEVGSDGRWTTALMSLSPVQSVWQLVSSFPRGFTSMLLSDLGKRIVKAIFLDAHEPSPCTPDASNAQRLKVGVFPDALATGSFGGFVRAPAKWCAQGAPADGHVELRLSNTGSLTFDFTQWAGPADTVGVSVAPDVSPLTRALLTFYNRGVKPGDDSTGIIYGPGVTVRFNVPASEQNQEEQISRGTAHTAAADSLFIITEHLGAIPGVSLVGALLDCLQTVTPGGAGFASVVGCLEKAAREGTSPRNVLEAIGRVLNVVSLLREATEIIAIGAETAINQLQGDINFQLRPLVVAPPGQPSDGNPATATGARILKRTGSTAAYVLDTDGVAHHIADGGTYVCNAKHYLVQFNVDDSEWAQEVHGLGADATCPSGPERALAPESVPEGLLLRRVDGETAMTRQLNGISYLVPLFGGQNVFNCMVEQYLVWDQVSYDEWVRFDPHPFLAAIGCGF
jgi:hypothetical protein